MLKEPLVSVIITCYNYDMYVEEAIESVLEQTHRSIELIIIDDGSTDTSLDKINRYTNHDRVTIVSRGNKGIVYTRNEGIGLAKGKYLFFLDADDFFSKDYIENMVSIAEREGADVVYPNWHVFGEETYTKEFPEFDIQRLIRQEIHCTSESLVRRSSVGSHVFEAEEVAEDWDFFLGLALDGRKFVLAKDCFINYRVRRNTRGSTHPYWQDMYSFYAILKKWQKKYPGVVNPIDLPIAAGKLRDSHISSQDTVIKQQNEDIRSFERKIGEKDEYIRGLEKRMHDLLESRSYKASRLVTAPYRLLKKAMNKRGK